MSSPSERPRITELRLDLAKRASTVSKDPALLEDLNRQPLETLLVTYLHLAVRSVAKRPRKVIVKTPDDPHFRKIAKKAGALLNAAETGGEMADYLCVSPHMRDFSVPGRGFAEWHDKDQLLAVMGYHVFQCEPRNQARTGSHVLAFVDRLTFTVIGAFEGNRIMEDPAERMRIWNLIQAHGVAPVSKQHLIELAIQMRQKVEELDPKLDDPAFVCQLYAETATAMPAAPKFRWFMPFMDFGFLETTAPRFFMIWPGQN